MGAMWEFLGRGETRHPRHFPAGGAGFPVLTPCSSQAWAEASGRYEGCPEDPAKWKTNFRCALASTGMFTLLKDHSKCGDDPHKVFAIIPGEPGPLERGCVGMGWTVSDCPSHTPLLPVGGNEGAFSSPNPVVAQQPQVDMAGLAGVGGGGVGWKWGRRHQGRSPLPLLRHSTTLALGCSQTGAQKSRGWRSG